MDSLKRVMVIGVAVAVGFFMVTSLISAETLKVAAVFPGSVTDQAGMQITYEGLMRAKENLKVETAYSEKVPQADQLEAMSDYARRGYDLVFGIGGEFTDAAKRAAQKYPKPYMVVINGAPAQGVVTLNFDNKQFGYVLGFTAGKMTKTGKVGIVSAQPLKVVLEGVEGLKKGLEKARPGSEVLLAYTNDYDDVAKAKEAALNQIAQGVDVILPYLDNGTVGVMKAAQEKGIKAVAVWTDLSKNWPEQNLVSVVMDFGDYLFYAVELAKEGKLQRKDYQLGLGTRPARLGQFNPAMPEKVKSDILQVVEDLKSGKLKM